MASFIPAGSVVLAVLDPGVGRARCPVVLRASGSWFVGPDNGLLSVLAGRTEGGRVWRITWWPAECSHSFHGRDIFAPVAAAIARGDFSADKLEEAAGLRMSEPSGDIAEIIYIDHYGNAMTGLRAQDVDSAGRLQAAGRSLGYAGVVGEIPPGEAFWYGNSLGLVEIAVNMGGAAKDLGLYVAQAVPFTPG